MSPEQEDTEARVLLVIPTLGKRLDYLGETLDSIRSQSVPADVVAVLPADAAEARALCLRYGAELVDDPGSLSAAVNLGMSRALPCHAYGNWLGDDDLLAPHSLEATSQALDRDADAAVAFGHCSYIDETGRELWVSRAGRKAVWLLGWGPDLVPQPGMLFRLEQFREVGGLDATLQFAMDLDLLLRLRRLGRFVDVGRQVSSFRWHHRSLTVSDRTTSLAESERVKHRYLPRALRGLAPVWDVPVRRATYMAANRMSARALALAGTQANRAPR